MPLGNARALADTCALSEPASPCPPATLQLSGPSVPTLVLCYRCGPSALAELNEEDAVKHRGAGLTPLAYVRREGPYAHLSLPAQAEQQVTQSPHDTLDATGVPPCDFVAPEDAPHSAAFFKVSCKHPTRPAFAVRACVKCLDDACEVLKDQGYFELRVTAPERPKLAPHRA